MQQVLIRLLSYSMSLTFKFWESNAVVLVFRKFLMMPEIVITLNQISTCIAYKSYAYRRHEILF